MSASYFPSRNACAPFALARLFGENYDDWCRHISAAGGDYQAVTCEQLHRLLVERGAISARSFSKRPRIFSRWRPDRGRWVAIVTGNGSRYGHCVTFRDGEALDNGWVTEGRYYGRQASLRVHAAWQLQ